MNRVNAAPTAHAVSPRRTQAIGGIAISRPGGKSDKPLSIPH